MQRRAAGQGGEKEEEPQVDSSAASKEASVREKVAAKRRNEKSWFATVARMYKRANEVVSVPFLLIFTIALGALFLFIDPEPTLAPDDAASPWIWRQGKGKDVVGEVNCTTYFHQGTGTLVEFGHGSGGGVSIRAKDGQPIRWIWDDGSVEDQEKLACGDIEEKLKAGKGKRGVPVWPLYNRYNKVFWTPSLQNQTSVLFRNALNPVTVLLHDNGFKFENNKGALYSVVDGVVEAGSEPARSAESFDSPYVEYLNVPGATTVEGEAEEEQREEESGED